MEAILEKLCTLLEEEAERQEMILSISQAQHAAVVARDALTVQARTDALDVLIRDSIQGQAERLKLLSQLVHDGGLMLQDRTLTAVIQVVHDPWRTRLHELQNRLRLTMESTRRIVRANGRALRKASSVTRDLLGMVMGAALPANEPTYGDRGSVSGQLRPAMIDQRG